MDLVLILISWRLDGKTVAGVSVRWFQATWAMEWYEDFLMGNPCFSMQMSLTYEYC